MPRPPSWALFCSKSPTVGDLPCRISDQPDRPSTLTTWEFCQCRDRKCRRAMSDQRGEAEQLYLKKSWTMEAIAQKLGVNRRTIERWAKEGEWSAKKKASKVVSINQPVSRPSPTPEDYPPIRSRRRTGQIDELEIIELAISDLSATLASGETDSRSLGGIAGALVRLLEYRRKIQPPTVTEVAELAIALGISPAEFARELRDRWQLRA